MSLSFLRILVEFATVFAFCPIPVFPLDLNSQKSHISLGSVEQLGVQAVTSFFPLNKMGLTVCWLHFASCWLLMFSLCISISFFNLLLNEECMSMMSGNSIQNGLSLKPFMLWGISANLLLNEMHVNKDQIQLKLIEPSLLCPHAILNFLKTTLLCYCLLVLAICQIFE